MLELEIQVQQIEDNYPFDLLLLADESLEAINAYINNAKVFSITLSNILVGVMAVLINNDNSIELKNIAIDEKYHRKGLGKQAINWLESYCKKNGINEVYVGTGDASHGQMIFY